MSVITKQMHDIEELKESMLEVDSNGMAVKCIDEASNIFKYYEY